MRFHFLTIFLLLQIAIMAKPVPYNVDKRKFPLGEEFQKLLPVKLGTWNRFAFHDFVPGQETGRVYYTRDKDQVYVTFGKAYSQAGLNTAWTKIYDDATDGKENEIKQKSVAGKTTRYLLMNGKSGFFYAWTRNYYYFTIEAKNKQLVDEFMTIFPY